MACVAEVGESGRLADSDAEFPEDVERTSITHSGLGVVAQLLFRITETVPDVPLVEAVIELAAESEPAPAIPAGTLVVAQERVIPANAAERAGLSRLVANGLVQHERSFVIPERVGVAALAVREHGQALIDNGLAPTVPELLVQRDAAGIVDDSLLIVSQVSVGGCEEASGDGLPGLITETRRGGQRRPHDSGPFLVVPAVTKVGHHGPGELPGVAVEPGALGDGDDGQQHVMLGFEPGQCLPVIGERLRSRAMAGWGKRKRTAGRVQRRGGGTAGVQVVVEDPTGGRVPLSFTVVLAAFGEGVGAQQVVEGITAGDVLGD